MGIAEKNNAHVYDHDGLAPSPKLLNLIHVNIQIYMHVLARDS